MVKYDFIPVQWLAYEFEFIYHIHDIQFNNYYNVLNLDRFLFIMKDSSEVVHTETIKYKKYLKKKNQLFFKNILSSNLDKITHLNNKYVNSLL